MGCLLPFKGRIEEGMGCLLPFKGRIEEGMGSQ
jgi:hypothetical protein